MPPRRVFVALGSNMGDRARHIRRALRRVHAFARVASTSFLYRSSPMYVTDQPAFFNAVAELRTDLAPLDLLRRLKTVEASLGRSADGVRNGPRPIDLDILLYGSDSVCAADGSLTIPHPRIHERDFVLRPLCDIDESVVVPGGSNGPGESAADLLKALRPELAGPTRGEAPGLARVLPLRCSTREFLEWRSRPKLMGIINTTPDSFSDGGKYRTVNDILRQVDQFAKRDFDIVDIGGYSTRPGAGFVSIDEERTRVEPAISAIRKEYPRLVISVDTFRSQIAAVASDVGADIVNDVSAGSMDANMAALVQKNLYAWVLMHMRGTPETMQQRAMTNYDGEGVTHAVADELSRSVSKAMLAGIPRWDLIVDPGIGFAKTATQSAELARNLKQWRSKVGGFPCLIGQSRKSSLTHLIPALKSEDASNRDFATAGAAIAAMSKGADVLRVHNPMVADAVNAAYELMQPGFTENILDNEHARVAVSEAV